jgi:demethylmenaquinone methyltransferase/2-methoxy-6-polyprenyl-1,4-benzoquinol methylase
LAGTGEIWPIFLARHGAAKKIIAIDISHQMHLHALDRLHRDRSDRIEHIEADFLRNELPAGIADCAISSFGLKTLSRDQQAVFARELARILKAGGGFALIEASDPKGWILRPLYRFYLDRVLPLVERFILKGAQDFSMIGIYTRTFGDCAHLEALLRQAGLETRTRRYFFGCATGLSGRKPPDA